MNPAQPHERPLHGRVAVVAGPRAGRAIAMGSGRAGDRLRYGPTSAPGARPWPARRRSRTPPSSSTRPAARDLGALSTTPIPRRSPRSSRAIGAEQRTARRARQRHLGWGPATRGAALLGARPRVGLAAPRNAVETHLITAARLAPLMSPRPRPPHRGDRRRRPRYRGSLFYDVAKASVIRLAWPGRGAPRRTASPRSR